MAIGTRRSSDRRLDPRVKTLDDAIAVMECPTPTRTHLIFTSSGRTARDFSARPSMVG